MSELEREIAGAGTGVKVNPLRRVLPTEPVQSLRQDRSILRLRTWFNRS